MDIISIGIVLVSFLLTRLLIPMVFNLLNEGNSIKENYKGERIPVCAGLVFIPIVTFDIFLLVLGLPNKDYSILLLFLLGILAMGLAGLLDDVLGNRNVTGLKGHLKSLFKGRLTTGGFKAAFGGLIALVVNSIWSSTIQDFFVNTLLIVLFTNLINLLDLRPGRAIKGFLICSIVLLLNPLVQPLRLLLYGLFGSVLAYLPYDIKAKSMMGDVGSNVLGISLGIACISIGLKARLIALILLILIHIYAEKHSITETVEKNKILKYIDQWGR